MTTTFNDVSDCFYVDGYPLLSSGNFLLANGQRVSNNQGLSWDELTELAEMARFNQEQAIICDPLSDQYQDDGSNPKDLYFGWTLEVANALVVEVREVRNAARNEVRDDLILVIEELLYEHGFEPSNAYRAFNDYDSRGYRHPATGKRWSGMGRRPGWLNAELAKGHHLHDFADRSGQYDDAYFDKHLYDPTHERRLADNLAFAQLTTGAA